MVSKGQFVGLDWNRITRLHSQVMIGTQEVKNSLTASRCHLRYIVDLFTHFKARPISQTSRFDILS